MAGDLRHETWEHLLKLTGENIGEGQLPVLLRNILNVDKLGDLSEPQAQKVLEALSPLPRLRHLVWESTHNAIEADQAARGNSFIKADAAAAADLITPFIVGALAELFTKNAQLAMEYAETQEAKID